MITLVSVNEFNRTLDLYGLSTDIKPTEVFDAHGSEYKVVNASTFFEMDNSAVFVFDEEHKQWLNM